MKDVGWKTIKHLEKDIRSNSISDVIFPWQPGQNMDDLCYLAVLEKAWLQVKMTLIELLPSFFGNFRASSARSCSIDVQLKSVEPQVSYCYWQNLAYHHRNCENLCVCMWSAHDFCWPSFQFFLKQNSDSD